MPKNEQRESTPPGHLLLTVGEVAGLINIGRTSVYELITAGQLRPVHIGRSCRFTSLEVQRYIARLDAPAAAIRNRGTTVTSASPDELVGASPTHRRDARSDIRS